MTIQKLLLTLIIMGSNTDFNTLSVVSYNMHGYNQGFSTVRDLCQRDKPSVFFIQEHWQLPTGLVKFEQHFPDYFTFGSSAMAASTESGLLRGRPFGGVVIMIRNDLQKFTRTLYSSDRCVIVKVFNFLLVNLYLPCVGTVDRILIIEDVLSDILNYLQDNSDCTYIIGGDFNCDLDGISQAADIINSFVGDNCLYRCDKLAGFQKVNTYANSALDCGSCVDYFIISCNDKTVTFDVIDEGSNLSDHLPIVISCRNDSVLDNDQNTRPADNNKAQQSYLRWDHADLDNYYLITGQQLQAIFNEIIIFESINDRYSRNEIITFVENVYNNVVHALSGAANVTVPLRSKQFYKFWWDQELDCLKEDSISSHKLWQAAGKPRGGPIFNKYRSCKLLYKRRIRECQRQETSSYTNDLHEALINKEGPAFWKTWRSKFETHGKGVQQVDGLTDKKQIVNKFEEYFSKTCSNLTEEGSRKLKEIYENKRPDYCGLPFDDDLLFDVELVEKSVSSLGRGKAAGLDSLTAEHLQHSHPALFCVLNKLFNLMIENGYVPDGFGLSYTVPLPKINNASLSKSLTVDDFRGISISPVLSKVFEKCILDRYQRFFETSDNQFGFKKGIGCSHAIYTVKCVVDHFVNQGSTINLCALDMKKAFDKMNWHGLFLKLMDRMLPVNALRTFEYWFSICSTCVRWGDSFSNVIKLKCGVRQGGVLSAYFFAIYIDDIIEIIQQSRIGCRIGIISVGIFLYADDIILLAPSVSALQQMLTLCENYLAYLDMALNAKKSVCLRIGQRHKDECSQLLTANGEGLSWVESCRYLGIYIVSAKKFKCSIDSNKKMFYRSFNAIYCKIGRSASEEVIIKLITSKCLPVFLYGQDACPLTLSNKRSMDFVMTRTFMRVFRTSSVAIVKECQLMFGFQQVSDVVTNRKRKFLQRFVATDNFVCTLFVDIANKELLTLTSS